MPVILCPECKGKLKMPENVEPRRVKCPTCNAIFLSSDAKVDGAPPPSTKSSMKSKGMNRSGTVGSALENFGKIGGKKNREEVVDDFEVVDEEESPPPRSRRSQPDNEDTAEERRPSARRRNDADEDDDRRDRRDRRRGREELEDDDDDDRRDRRRSRREDYDDDDEEDDRRGRSRRDDRDDPPRRKGRDRDRDLDDSPKSKINFDGVRVALVMHAIGSWCMGAALGLMTIFFIAMWARINGLFLSQIAGVVSIGFIIVSGIAYGFCIAGPNRNGMLGLAIASLAITTVRLILVIVAVSQGGGGSGLPGVTTSVLGFITIATPIFGIYLYALFNGAPFSFELFAMVGVEIAQLIVFTLYLQAAAKTSRDRGGEAESSTFVMFWSVGTGVIAFSGLAVILLIRAFNSATAAEVLFPIYFITVTGSLGGLYAWHGFVVQSVNEGLDESGARRGKNKKRRR